jgi:hypothetical protein
MVDLGCREDGRARKRDEVVALRGGRERPDLRAKAAVWSGNAIDPGVAAAACALLGFMREMGNRREQGGVREDTLGEMELNGLSSLGGGSPT